MRGHQAQHCPTKKGTLAAPAPSNVTKSPAMDATTAPATATQHPTQPLAKAQQEITASNPPNSQGGLAKGFTAVLAQLKTSTICGGVRKE
ncbi:unnamed protein product [Calypogeia fissa]